MSIDANLLEHLAGKMIKALKETDMNHVIDLADPTREVVDVCPDACPIIRNVPRRNDSGS